MKTLRSIRKSKRIAVTEKLNRFLNVTELIRGNEVGIVSSRRRYGYEMEF
ncbi:hypothetical protein [Aquimarina addita]